MAPGRRYLVDAIILTVVAVAAEWPFVRQIATTYGDYFDATLRATQNGTQPPRTAELIGRIAGPLAAYGAIAIAIAVSFVYNVAFLKTVQATPGKLLVGLGAAAGAAAGAAGAVAVASGPAALAGAERGDDRGGRALRRRG